MGGGREGGGEFGQKNGGAGRGGGGERTPAIGSFLRLLVAAEFRLVNQTIGRVCEVMQEQPKWQPK